MEEILKESVIDSCIYLGTDDNPYLVLKKFVGNDGSDVTIYRYTKLIMKNAFKDRRINILAIYRESTGTQTPLTIEEDAFDNAQITRFWGGGLPANKWAESIFFKNPKSNPLQYSEAIYFSNVLMSGNLNLTSATVINPLAFYNCKQITSVQLRDATYISAGAFAGCDNLEKVIYTGSNWCNIVFENETANPLYYAKKMFDNTGDTANEITSITLNTSHINNYAFINWEGLRDVNVSNTVETIGYHVFDGCTNLVLNQDGQGLYIGTDTKILVSLKNDSTELCENSYVWVCDSVKSSVTNNITYYLDTNHKILAKAGSDFTDLNGVEFILSGAFQNISNILEEIELVVTSTVKSINSNAFSDCKSLKTISFDENSALIHIGNYAFSGCTELKFISLPNSFSFCGEGCFSNCSKLQTINFGSRLNYIPSYCCYNCSSLVQFMVAQQNALTIGVKAFYNCQKLTSFNYTIPLTQATGQIDIKEGAFDQCIGLQSLSLIASHINIEKTAFFGCLELETIYIDTTNNLTIGEDAFGGCYNIVEVCTPHDIGIVAGSPAYGFLGYYAAAVVTTPKTFQNIDNYRLYGDLDATGVIDYTTAFIVKYLGEDIELTLPEVYGIKSYAFYNNQEITQINIPNLTNILQIVGHHAFDKCNKLHFHLFNNGYYLGNNLIFVKPINSNINELKIAPQTQFICMGALMDCNQLLTLEVPFIGDRKDTLDNYYKNSSLGYIFGKNIFDNTTLTNLMIYVNDNFTNVAYYLPTSITSLTLSSNVNMIDYAALSGFGSLTSLTIPFVGRSANETTAGPTTLLGYIFGGSDYTGASAITQSYGSSSSQSVTYYIPSELSNIKILGGSEIFYGAFSNCIALNSVELADSTLIIGQNIFNGCNHLSNLVLPFIGNRSDATSPSASTLFGYIFGPNNDNSISQMYFDSSRQSYQTVTYYLPADLRTVSVTLHSMLGGAFSRCAQLTSITLPTDITNIERDVFYDCTGLTSISIPSTVTSIGTSAFDGCTALTNLEGFADTNIDTIEYGLFRGCSALESIVIPDSVTVIGTSAFQECTSLTNVTLPEGLLEIQGTAFRNCSLLTSITLPDGIQKIGSGTFYGCTSFTYFTIPDSIILIGSQAFDMCDNLIYNSDGYGQYLGNTLHPCLCLIASYNPPSESFIFNEYCKIIYNSVFNGWTQLSSITLPDGLTDIGSSAFYGCTGLASITFANNLIRIQSSAFYGCTGLATITTPASLKTIGSSAFRNCHFTEGITLTEGVEDIDNWAFANSLDSDVANFTFPTSLTHIGSSVLSGCGDLWNVTIPFVGGNANETTASSTTLFGYIFGTTNYTNSVAKEQHWASGSGHSVTYRLPRQLLNVRIKSGELLYGAFYNCSNIDQIYLYPGVTRIGSHAFYMTNLGYINFEGTMAQWGEITLDPDWRYQASINSVYCTDGRIIL